MVKKYILFFLIFVQFQVTHVIGKPKQSDTLKTNSKDLIVTLIGHGSLMFSYDGIVVHMDPWTKKGDYSKLSKADYIFITHSHPDHLDQKAINLIKKNNSVIYANPKASSKISGSHSLVNGDTLSIQNIFVEVIPAYNLVHKRKNGAFWHPKGNGNGYILTMGGLRILVAGDTENIPEIKNLQKIDVAFLPMNVPYTMSPEMAADAVRGFSPKILYPYHTGNTDKNELIRLLKDFSKTEIRLRKNM